MKIIGLLFLFVLIITGSNQVTAITDSQSVIVPGYSYPSNRVNRPFWNTTFSGNSNLVPFIIVNPASGPVDTLDANYLALKNKMANGGYEAIGYIATDWQTKDINQAKLEVDKWFSSWGNSLKGIFLDEVLSTTNDQLCWIANIYNYIKSKNPSTVVFLNPGTKFNKVDFLKYGDIFVLIENTADRYINTTSRWTESGMMDFEKDPKNANRIYHIIHTITTKEQHDQVMTLSKERNAGWIYFTTDADERHYNDPSTYFGDMLSGITSLKRTSVVSRPMEKLPDSCINQLGLDFSQLSDGNGNLDINVKVGETLSMNVDTLAEMNITPQPLSARMSSDDIKITASTNNVLGYSLKLSSVDEDTALVHNANSNLINAHSGTLNTPSELATNTWGYRIDGAGGFGNGPTSTQNNVEDSGLTWAGIKPASTPDTVKTQSGTINNDVTKVWFGTKVNSGVVSGSYIKTVMITLISNI